MKARRIISSCAQGTAIFLFIYLLAFPKYAAEPTKTALSFCAAALVPGLFIYMILAKIIMGMTVMQKLERILGLEAVLLLLGTLCGCPVGAKTAVSLYDSRKITEKHAEYICTFSNNASVSFVVGFVGAELLGDVRLGLWLLIFQITASAVTAVVMKYVIFGKEPIPKTTRILGGKCGLWEAVSDSAATMMNLCACVVFFMVAGGVFTKLVPLSPALEAVFKSVLEFSSGCAAAAKIGKHAFVLCAFALGQTGGSVALQVKSVVGSRFSITPYLWGKLISGTVMTLLAIIFG